LPLRQVHESSLHTTAHLTLTIKTTLSALHIALGALVLVTALPSAAQAQIYAWRDSDGKLVLSDRKKDQGAVVTTYSVNKAETFRTTAKGILNERSVRYDALIEQNAEAQGVNPHLVRAVIQQESGFNPNARSHKGAMGLMQLMPGTAAELGVTDPYDPSENIRGGVAYLKGLLVKFEQNIELALAAYNAGPTAVTRYGTVPPYRETQNYVTRIKTAVDAVPKGKSIYKTIEIVNGREVPRYSTKETPDAELVAAPKR
jgi:soluble lytic murein transglycosylase-like protein